MLTVLELDGPLQLKYDPRLQVAIMIPMMSFHFGLVYIGELARESELIHISWSSFRGELVVFIANWFF